jgi:predicted TIM-barrel fold metal-dependent hydrolase
MIIDLENHFTMENPKLEKSFKSGKICERYWGEDGKMHIRISQEASRIERFLQFMDEAGIDMAGLSNHSYTLEKWKKWHDFCADLVEKYPKRFVGFASVEPLGGQPAFDELERAVKDLDMRCVHIHARNKDLFLDDKAMWPFYEKVCELGVPVNVHIATFPKGFDALHAPYALHYVVARELDMITAVLRVCFGGVLEDFPDLKLIMNHFGGGVTGVIERFDAYTEFAEQPGWPGFYRDKPLITKSFTEYFDKLYFNMAGREYGMAALEGALTRISPKKLVFGTDWPLNYDYAPEKVKEFVADIKKLDLPIEDIDAMLGGNAVELLRIGK